MAKALQRANGKGRGRKGPATQSTPTSEHEKALFQAGAMSVAGIDEVGRGAWAGPLSVGVAVVTMQNIDGLPGGVNDSKLLRPSVRHSLFEPLKSCLSAYAVGHASSVECDKLGMTAAQRLATRRAIKALGQAPDAVIVDGRFNFTDFEHAKMLVGGDRLSLAVAAASILAKVTRDALMVNFATVHPAYDFEHNKGYPAAAHLHGLAEEGLSAIHRHSWSFASKYSMNVLT